MNIILSDFQYSFPLAGIGCYSLQLLQGLQKHPEIKQVILSSQKKIIENSIPPESIRKIFYKRIAKNIIKSIPYMHKLYFHHSIHTMKKSLKCYSPEFLKQTVYHELNYLFKSHHSPKMCTVYDLSHIDCPQHHLSHHVKHLLYYLPQTIAKANHIVSPSYYTKERIMYHFKVPDHKISVIPLGIDCSTFKPRSAIETHEILKRYQLYDKTYLLSVGTLEPRKNIQHLIKAFQYLPNALRTQYPLVLVGQFGWKYAPLKPLIQELCSCKQLYYLNYVPQNDLPFLYSGAYAFSYVSLYEGFGLPLLEALASGIPTLTSTTSALPEVVGEAALLVNPCSIKEIALGLEQLLTDQTIRQTLKQKGIQQAAQFSWETHINQIIPIYQSLL